MAEWFDDENFYGPFDLSWWNKPLRMRPGARVTMGSLRIHESRIGAAISMADRLHYAAFLRRMTELYVRNTTMPTVMLSPHFTLAEFLISETASRMGIPNQPSADDYENLTRLAGVMEKVRTILGDKPITITSGYRGPQLNAAVGGSSTSAHMVGLGADFIVPGFGDPLDICNALKPHVEELGIDQLIHEYGDWCHLGLVAPPTHPRCQCLTINNYGTSEGFA